MAMRRRPQAGLSALAPALPLLALAGAFLLFGLQVWQVLAGAWLGAQGLVSVYRAAIPHGVTFSLNELERTSLRSLPSFDFRGVMLDPEHEDWVLFGEKDPGRPGIPVEAIGIALRALQQHLEPPGVDIRAGFRGPRELEPLERVQYFGGVEGTRVGKWLFAFDHWMKRASLGKAPIPAAGARSYWTMASEDLEREVRTCRSSEDRERFSHNRYWLCLDDLTGTESGDTLTFERAALRVLAERIATGGMVGFAPAGPCASRGADDRLATEFAASLTEHLAELGPMLPVREIEDFGRLLAGLNWLSARDPLRDLTLWLERGAERVATVAEVETESVEETREHEISFAGGRGIHRHTLRVSGGVVLLPVVVATPVAQRYFEPLREAVLGARPEGHTPSWPFTYIPTRA
jgi:hypothetical protein